MLKMINWKWKIAKKKFTSKEWEDEVNRKDILSNTINHTLLSFVRKIKKVIQVTERNARMKWIEGISYRTSISRTSWGWAVPSSGQVKVCRGTIPGWLELGRLSSARVGSARLTCDYKAISVQLQLQLPTGTELSNKKLLFRRKFKNENW